MKHSNQISSVLLLTVLLMKSALFAFAGGSGTSTDPFQITTADHLNDVRNYLGDANASKYFKVMNDIDLTDYLSSTGAGYHNGAFWSPIATIETASFKGKFDGSGFVVKNLKINLPTGDNTGLFGYLGAGAEVKNISLINADVTGKNATGILIGTNRGGSIINSASSGKVFGATWVGGLVGFNESSGVNGLISKCFSTASVSGTGSTAGGLVGQNWVNSSGVTIIENSYATGSVNCVDYAGGLVGHQLANGTIRFCYSTGAVTNSGNAVNKGGLLGFNTGSVLNSYWNKETSRITTSAGSDPSFGKTSVDMKKQTTYTGWDFTNIWHISIDNNGYPHPGWQLLFCPVIPTANYGSNQAINGFTANWSETSGADGYFLDVATDNNFTNFVSGYNNKIVGLVTNYTVTGLTKNTLYYYRLKAYNSIGTSDYSNTMIVATLNDFTEKYVGLTDVYESSVAWGDHDNDGDLDILLAGLSYTPNPVFKVYNNNNNSTFSDITSGLDGIRVCSVAWGDYDNDGDLDILLTGTKTSKIYRNNGNNTFSDINAGLPDVEYGSVAWGDYDNDGDLDILLTGFIEYQNYISKVYRNNGNNTFSDINAGLTGVSQGSTAWGDYDNDGDLDILLTGYVEYYNFISKIYRNNGNGSFTDINAGLPGVSSGSVAWGDYDSDGYLDILLTGNTGSSDPYYNKTSKIYHNNGNNTFTDINAGLIGVDDSSAAWGDYDNDGDLDILLAGKYISANYTSKVYRNNGNNTFTDINAGLIGVHIGSVAWGDYDNDGDLDILLTGEVGNFQFDSKVYHNNSLIANTAPDAPANLSVQATENGFKFSWDKATDSQTPQNGLSYNIAIGGASNLNSKKSSHSNLTDGWRKIVEVGNTSQVNSYSISPNLPQITCKWSVQAIDNSFAGSAFIAGPSISTRSLAIFNDAELSINQSVIWESAALDFVTGYQIQISTTESFAATAIDTLIAKSNLVTKVDKGFISLKLNRLNIINNLQSNTTYYWRMRPIYNVGFETFFSPTPGFFVYKTQSPNSPTNGLPSGTSVAVTTTTLNWTAPAAGVAPTGYSVYLYSAEDCFTTPIINGATVTATSFSGLNLKYNTNYRAKVFANYDPEFKGTSPALDWDFKTESKPGYTVSGQVAFDGGYLLGYFIAGTFNETNPIYSVNVAQGDSVVLEPKSTGYAFTPAKTTLRNVTASQTVNFTAADTLAPVVKALAQSVSNGQNQVAKAQSNESSGFVYVIKESENPQSITDIDALITAKKAAKTAVAQAYTDYNITTTGLLAGNYYAYAADKWNNLSAKGLNLIFIDQALAIDDDNLPVETKLYDNYPNPFNPQTEIKFDLKTAGVVKLSVYSIKGELVKTLVNGLQNAGRYSVNFDGSRINSGVYFYKLEADGRSMVKRMLMVK